MSRDWKQYKYEYGEESVPTGVEIVWEHLAGDYDWQAVAIITRTRGDDMFREYAVYEDSGCSCRYAFEDHPDQYDFAWTIFLPEITRRVNRAIDNVYDLDPAKKATEKASAHKALIKFYEGDA